MHKRVQFRHRLLWSMAVHILTRSAIQNKKGLQYLVQQPGIQVVRNFILSFQIKTQHSLVLRSTGFYLLIAVVRPDHAGSDKIAEFAGIFIPGTCFNTKSHSMTCLKSLVNSKQKEKKEWYTDYNSGFLIH